MTTKRQGVDTPGIARRTTIDLRPDPSRLTVKLFVAGQEDFGATESRTNAVVNRIMSLSDTEVGEALAGVEADFAHRHADFLQWLDVHAHRATHRIDPHLPLSENRWRLIGAYFSHEFAVEGAALCNPSAVVHPDQSGLAPGMLRFMMSTRCIGEGHRSSIGFRTGTIDTWGDVVVDDPGDHLTTGIAGETPMTKAGFRGLLESAHDFGENSRSILRALPEAFTSSQLEEQLNVLLHDRDTYRNVDETIHHFRHIAERTYLVTFPAASMFSERVMWPRADAERRGMEDARFTRFVDRDARSTYLGTYTAFDGRDIAQQGIQTDDFTTFRTFPISGPAARGKGLAIFPRTVSGQFVALTRPDFETNHIAFSDEVEYWEASAPLRAPSRSWEVIQQGNCGSPIETEAGWLVITHSVGPFRTYHLGVMLLDNDDPCRVIGTLDSPLLSPVESDRNGYVPNVVYSCGSLVHERHLMIPIGVADQSIGVATVPIEELLERLTR
jgi:predicted GH43/DUF377 family glycosyl hydrolase